MVHGASITIRKHSGRVYTEHTELYWKTLEATVEEYMNHSESKFENGDRIREMKRRHIVASEITCIGKELNELEESEVLGLLDEPYTKYTQRSENQRIRSG